MTPNCSMTSALPHWLETERFPCLATRRPHPATTKAVVVDTLKVLVPSPPVPHVSTTVSRSRLISSRSMLTAELSKPILVAFLRMTRAAPVISAMVSPFNLSAVMKAPIWAGVAWPLIITSIAPSISSSLRSMPSTTFWMAVFSMVSSFC